MITGLQRFTEFFRDHQHQFVLIGGVAAMHWLDAAALHPRATRDFDLVVLIEALDDIFLDRFWQFVKAGGYGNLNKSTGDRTYYRFTSPTTSDFPSTLEVFSRAPEGLALWDSPRIIPIPASGEASSLSAILMDDEYYSIVRDGVRIENGLPLLSPSGLILLKAKAWLDLSARRLAGEKIDEKNIKKHRSDVFKLSLLLTPSQRSIVPRSVYKDLQEYLRHFPLHSPEWESIRQASGLPGTFFEPSALLHALNMHFHVQA